MKKCPPNPAPCATPKSAKPLVVYRPKERRKFFYDRKTFMFIRDAKMSAEDFKLPSIAILPGTGAPPLKMPSNADLPDYPKEAARSQRAHPKQGKK